MTELDAAALERASAPAVELLGLQTLRSDGQASAVSGFGAFGRVYVTAAVAEFHRESRSDAVTLTIEQSADGLSWTEAASFEFSADGVQFATIDAPADQLRVSWALTGRLRCRVVGVTATPGSLDAVSGPGGSSAVLSSGAIPVSAAQIADLHDTPVTLVARPAGKILWPLSAIIVFTPGGTPFTEGVAEFTNIGWAGQSALGDQILGAAVPQVLTIDCQRNFEGFYDLTDTETDIVLTHGGANPGGAGDGTLEATVYYIEFVLPT